MLIFIACQCLNKSHSKYIFFKVYKHFKAMLPCPEADSLPKGARLLHNLSPSTHHNLKSTLISSFFMESSAFSNCRIQYLNQTTQPTWSDIFDTMYHCSINMFMWLDNIWLNYFCTWKTVEWKRVSGYSDKCNNHYLIRRAVGSIN